jgi:hypothetical protein
MPKQTKKPNPRRAKLEKIQTKLAMFLVEVTFVEESEVQKGIGDVIVALDKVGDMIEANDAAAEAAASSGAADQGGTTSELEQ